MSGTLEVFKNHHPHEVTYMQTVGGRVDTQICDGHFFFQLLIGAGHHLMNHAAPSKFVDKIHWYLCFLIVKRMPQIYA